MPLLRAIDRRWARAVRPGCRADASSGGEGGDAGGRPAGGADRWRFLHPGIGDPLGQREAAQPDQPVRRLGGGDRDVPCAGQLDLRLDRDLPDDGQLAVQVGGGAGDRLGELAGRDGGQEAVVEVLPELVVAGRRPARLAGVAEPLDDPADVGQGIAIRDAGLLERGPARPAMLAGDGGLGVVQGGELPGGQAALGLELEVPQARPGGQCSSRRCSIGHGQSFLTPGVRWLGQERRAVDRGNATGELAALPADPGAAGTTTANPTPVAP